MKELDDKRFIDTLAEGDMKAFEILFLRYQPRLVRFLIGFLQDEEVARDMAQDIFLSIWNNRMKIKNVDSFSSFIFKMARNAVYNHFDHLLVREKYSAAQLLEPYETDSIEENIFASELQSIISIAVDQMPEQRQKIFRMSRIDGISNDKIADVLNISKRTVENHLTFALRDLRKVVKLTMTFFL